MHQKFSTVRTAIWLIVLEFVFFLPDVLGSAWAQGKSVLKTQDGALLVFVLIFFALGYVGKSVLQRRFRSLLLFDIIMSIVSNAAGAFADWAIFGRSVNVNSLMAATIGLAIMTVAVHHLEVEGTSITPMRRKKDYVDVVTWVLILVLLIGLNIAQLSQKAGIPVSLAVIVLGFIASVFSKTGSNLQKQAFQKLEARKCQELEERRFQEEQLLLAQEISALMNLDDIEAPEAATFRAKAARVFQGKIEVSNKELLEEVFTHPRYMRGVLGNLSSQLILAHISVLSGIAGVSVIRSFFSFAISAYLSYKDKELVLKGTWGFVALVGFAVFLVSTKL
jgi:hypothetical protein